MMLKKRILLVTAVALALGSALTFLPLYDCALCELYKDPRPTRRFCACNDRGKSTLLQVLAGREEVHRYMLENECNGGVLRYPPRPLDPASWEALRELLAKEDSVFAVEVVKGDYVEKYLPHVPLFQLWKRNHSGVWKLFGFDRDKKELFEISAPNRLDPYIQSLRIDAKNTVDGVVKHLIEMPHQSLVQAGAPSSLVLAERDSGITVMVKADGRTVEARNADGSVAWEVDVLAKCGNPKIGPSVIRHLSLGSDGTMVATYGKHSFGGTNLRSGEWRFLGSD